MNRSSIFGKKIDFEKSEGCYLYDKISNKKFIDFFGMYSSVSIGYNHEIFNCEDYKDELLRVSNVKITNCEMLSDESSEFDEMFRNYTSLGVFDAYHYTCTGALAIEAAIKTAMDYKGSGFQRIVSFKGSFHGINSYGGIITDRFDPVSQRLDGFPGGYYEKFTNPIITYEKGKPFEDKLLVEMTLNEVKETITQNNDTCAIVVEPIQCTFGDRYFPNSFFIGLREIASEYDIPLIFDEVQVGFGATGKIWFFENTPIKPDIICFGKKTQLSGIAVQKKFTKIFQKSIRLEVTWDADLLDMVRCKQVMKAYKKYNVLDNVRDQSKILFDGLKENKFLLNVRNKGLLFAFDFENKKIRDHFVIELEKNGLICNPTRDKTIRFRPHLLIKKKEIIHALEIIRSINI